MTKKTKVKLKGIARKSPFKKNLRMRTRFPLGRVVGHLPAAPGSKPGASRVQTCAV
jgi:hypothetical protein